MRSSHYAALVLLGLGCGARATAQTPVLVADLNPGAASSDPQQLTWCCGNTLFFSADDGQNGQEPWRLDTAGPALVADIHPGAGGSWPRDFTATWVSTAALTFFTARPSPSFVELWQTDGATTARTMSPVPPGVVASSIAGLVGHAGYLAFFRSVYDPTLTGTPQLFRSNGTLSGTVAVDDFLPDGDPVLCSGQLFCVGRYPPFGSYLHRLDPISGAQVIGGSYSSPRELVSLNGELAFTAQDGAHGRELWASDGSRPGTRLVEDLLPGSASSDPRNLTACGNAVYFTARVGSPGVDYLYRSSLQSWGNTTLGQMVDASNLTACNGKLFFTAADTAGTAGTELWVSDGTGAGTVIVRDIVPGPRSSSPSALTAVGDLLYFTADDGVTGRELWVSDGTAKGTRLVADLFAGSGSSSPGWLTAAGNRLYFVAEAATFRRGFIPAPRFGRELYSIDTTTASRELLGEGCEPSLWMDTSLPRLGSNLQLFGNAAPQTVGFVLTGQPRSRPVPLWVGRGCASWLDMAQATPQVGASLTNPSGIWIRTLAIPQDNSLIGTAVIAQTVFLDQAGVPVQASNAVRLVYGL